MKIIITESDRCKLNVLNSKIIREDVNIVYQTDDGIELCEALKKFDVDIVVLNAFLRNSDMFENIRYIKGNYPTVKLIVIIDESKEHLISRIFSEGADYVMFDPLDGEVLYRRMNELYNSRMTKNSCQSEIKSYTVSVLNRLSVRPTHLGYKYIIQAIMLAFDDLDYLERVSKCLYPKLAKDDNGTPQQVERAIRNAVESAYKRTEEYSIYKNIGFGSDIDIRKPCNSYFLFVLFKYVSEKFGLLYNKIKDN